LPVPEQIGAHASNLVLHPMEISFSNLIRSYKVLTCL